MFMLCIHLKIGETVVGNFKHMKPLDQADERIKSSVMEFQNMVSSVLCTLEPDHHTSHSNQSINHVAHFICLSTVK